MSDINVGIGGEIIELRELFGEFKYIEQKIQKFFYNQSCRIAIMAKKLQTTFFLSSFCLKTFVFSDFFFFKSFIII